MKLCVACCAATLLVFNASAAMACTNTWIEGETIVIENNAKDLGRSA